MVRKILISLLFLSNQALAEGQLSLGLPVFSTDGKEAELGLYVRENINDKLYYQSWSGVRYNHWSVSNHALMYNVTNDTSVGVGPSIIRANDKTDFRGMIQLNKQLWK